MTNSYLEIHVLQTVPSSNINRDDTGAPKTAQYGGVTRARVSSQSWKHAMRHDFDESGVNNEGMRTMDAPAQLAKALQALDPELSDEDAIAKAAGVFGTAGIKLDKDNRTKALFMISQGQVEKLAEYATNNDELDKKEIKALFNGSNSLDLALFGRMAADNPELNVDASAQVAHAVSTHAIVPEFDYYTAVDDLKPDDTAGASMLGTIEYNSSTLYRYANVNVDELNHNLGGADAVKGALQFIKSFVLSMPTGKQNTFANKTLPKYVLITLRHDTPVNLVSAFEKPVTEKGGYMQPSVKALEQEYADANTFVEQPDLAIALTNLESAFAGDEKAASLPALLEKVGTNLKQVVADEDTNN